MFLVRAQLGQCNQRDPPWRSALHIQHQLAEHLSTSYRHMLHCFVWQAVLAPTAPEPEVAAYIGMLQCTCPSPGMTTPNWSMKERLESQLWTSNGQAGRSSWSLLQQPLRFEHRLEQRQLIFCVRPVHLDERLGRQVRQLQLCARARVLQCHPGVQVKCKKGVQRWGCASGWMRRTGTSCQGHTAQGWLAC